jgi:hypothetical protein
MTIKRHSFSSKLPVTQEWIEDYKAGFDVNDGGFLIPETACIDVAKSGVFWALVRLSSRAFYRVGVYLAGLGCYKKEIHPHVELISMMREAKIK